MNIHNVRNKDEARPIVLLRTDQATFPDYASDTFSYRDIVGDRLTSDPLTIGVSRMTKPFFWLFV